MMYIFIEEHPPVEWAAKLSCSSIRSRIFSKGMRRPFAIFKALLSFL